MFILILFGYRQSRIFTLECLTSTLMDCIWIQCNKEISKILNTREELHLKEIGNLNKKILANEKRLEVLNKQLQDEALLNQDAQQTKKDDKKAVKAPVNTKKGKDNLLSGSPLENERTELLRESGAAKEAITKYEEKLVKIAEQKVKQQQLTTRLQNGQITLELCDKAGERKFVKTKLTNDASTFLSDKNSYILAYLAPGVAVEDDEIVEPVQLDGFAIRTVEEDVGAVDESLIQQKKDDKKKGKKK